MEPVSAAVVAGAALAAGAYVNAKWSVGIDLMYLQYDRAYGKRLGEYIRGLGDTVTLYNIFDRVNPAVEALWFEGKTWTYGELKKDVVRLAAFLEDSGIKKNDAVALFTTNSPEMVVIILALSKLSAVAGLVNINLRDDTLKYCLEVSTAQTIISTADLASVIPGDRRHFTLNLGSFTTEFPLNDSPVTLLDTTTLPTPTTITPATKAGPADLAALIFTSGTTGKPKACAIRNHQMCVTSCPTSRDMSNPTKYFPLRTYSPLPLFHGTALFTGICYTLGTQGTLCLARKFSSSRFWKDVHDSQATRILYVGELCRYLVTSPPTEWDQNHNCIVASGNGLRGEIWEKFKQRFNVPEIREFYRSTEGLAKYDNIACGAWGAGKVGFAGPLRRFLEKDTWIIKVDSSGSPWRNPKTGFCERVGLNEPGEVIGRIKARGLLTEYLNNEQATEEKILRDVFVKGDMWQRMGDLVVQEDSGWVRFHDRMGDTFRWKGENVSAGEVRDHIAKLEGVSDAVVYGVKLASYDGTAGAATLTLDVPADAFMSTLSSNLKKTGLPAYAMPRLVRVAKEIETNATFKKSKNDLMKKSWRVEDAGDDRLYWLDGTVYKRLDEGAWRGIEGGSAKL